MIDAGRLEREDANNILEQARAVGQSSSKMPAWMLKTPEQLIQESVVQSKIDEAIKENYYDLAVVATPDNQHYDQICQLILSKKPPNSMPGSK